MLTARFSLVAAARACLVLSLLAAPPSFAEDAPVMEELVVTAGLVPIQVAETASTVTVITREQIEQRQARFLTDLLRDVPGFAVSQSGGPGAQTQIRVRGAEGNHVLVLIDGIRANDPASGDEFNFQYQSTANIERIEIVRGPQSAIWGTDALAGVINIIRRKAVNDRYLSAAAELGSFDSRMVGVDGGISQGPVRLTAGMSWMETEGTNVSREGDERDGSDNRNANFTLEIDAAEAWTLLLSGQRVEATTEFDEFDAFGTGLPADADRSTDADRHYARAEARYVPAGEPWSGTASVNWMETSNDNHADGAWESSTGAETLEWRLRATRMLDSENDHRLTAALDHEGVDFHQRGSASPWGDPNQDQSYDRSGYAAEYLGKPLDGFSWTANARLDRFSDFDDAFTWQLGAAHRLDSGIKLRASLGTGSKAPSFIERYGFYPDFFLGNPALKPETSSGWEAGVYLPLADHRFSLDFTWFDQELEDEIDGFVFDPQTLLFTARNKENASVRKGVEVVFEGQPVADLTFSVSYTYLDACELDENGGRSREIRRPRHLATLALRYAFGAGRGHLNLTVNYNGGQLDNYYPPPTFLPEQVELDSYTLADLAVSWRLGKRWELTGRIENLLDEDYEEILGYARPGRAVHAGLRARFGP